MPELSVTPLERALARLEAGLVQSGQEPANELSRDGVIQRFEFTMDLCWKLLQRYLKDYAQIGDAAIRTRKDLFREGARLELIADAEAWILHYEARNETSHTYNNSTAERVYERAKVFATDARELLEALRDAARRKA